MPSLPPDLKPWMMRPRAGQRNSGSVPGSVGLRAGQRDLRLRRAGFEVARRHLVDRRLFPSADLGGSASATASPLDPLTSFDADLLRVLVGLGGGLLFLFVFLCSWRTWRHRRRRRPNRRFFRLLAYQRWRRRGHRRDRRAPPDAFRSSPPRRSKGRWPREAQKPARRSGLKSCPASRHCRRQSASRRRRSNPRPIHPPPAASRAKRCALRSTRRDRPGRAATSSRRTTARRECASRVAREGIGERTVALVEARDVGRTSRQKKKAEPGQRKTRNRAPFCPLQRNHSSASTHAHATAQ